MFILVIFLLVSMANIAKADECLPILHLIPIFAYPKSKLRFYFVVLVRGRKIEKVREGSLLVDEK